MEPLFLPLPYLCFISPVIERTTLEAQRRIDGGLTTERAKISVTAATSKNPLSLNAFFLQYEGEGPERPLEETPPAGSRSSYTLCTTIK